MHRRLITRSAIFGLSLLLAMPAASTALRAAAETDTSPAAYPLFDIQGFCRDDAETRRSGRFYACEDREHAVAILLKEHWSAVKGAEPDLVEVCIASARHNASRPSYVALLQCITRVHDAAD